MIISVLLINHTLSGQTYTIDIDRSSISWTGYGELGSFEQNGTIKFKEGSIEMTDGQLEHAQIVVDMKSIEHEDAQLKRHLKNKDFFHVQKYPEARLELERIENDEVSGLLFIRGKEGSVVFPISFQEDDNALVIKGKMTVDRTKFDIKYNSSSFFQDLGNYAIKNEFDLEFEMVCTKVK